MHLEVQGLGHDNSSEPPKDITSYDMGIGRSYECVFCKRGFTTAQALGGHMNIHRKDRKVKANPSLLLNQESNNPSFPPAQITQNTIQADSWLSSQTDGNQFLTSNLRSLSNPRFPNDASHNCLPSCNCCKENWSGASLGLHIGVPSSYAVASKRMRPTRGGFSIHHQDVEELDLELRLGHLDP